MHRDLSQLESILLKKANAQLKNDIDKKIDEICKILSQYGIGEKHVIYGKLSDLLIDHIKQQICQESILLKQSNDLLDKLDDIEDIVYDTLSDCPGCNNH